MKKIILYTLLLASCSSNDVTISREEYNKLKGKRIVTFNKGSCASEFNWRIIRGSDGHQYLENSGNAYAYVMMHYIECKKCKSNKDK